MASNCPSWKSAVGIADESAQHVEGGVTGGLGHAPTLPALAHTNDTTPGRRRSGVVITTWRVRDSNPRRRCQLIYSQPPLATRVTRRGCLPNERTPRGERACSVRVEG